MSDSLFDAAGGMPIRDEMTGEIVEDSDGMPITELEGHDYLELARVESIEERAAGERAWRYGHVIVDEAQDLTPMQWRMVARRARGHSMTLVGDLAQRSVGASGGWTDLLPAELGDVARFELTTNYRSPAEVAAISRRLLAELAPGLTPPMALRSSGHPPEFRATSDLRGAVEVAVAELVEQLEGGRVALIGFDLDTLDYDDVDHPLVTVLTPQAAKGLEFDAVVIVEPARYLEEPNGLSLLYVAITRTTDRLVVVHSRPLPTYLRS